MVKTIVLIACGAKKLDHAAPAGELYQGSLFKKCKQVALHVGDDFRIISAKHGLLEPTRVVEPYNEALKTSGGRVDPMIIRMKIARPLEELAHAGDVRIVALLPQAYASVLPGGIINLMPKGLTIGRMMAHLDAMLREPRKIA